MAINIVNFSGNLGADPEVKTTANGKKVVKASLASTKRYRDAGGEYKDRTTWMTIRCWGELADELKKFRKGDEVQVAGELGNDSWEGRDGQKRTQVLIEVSMIGRKERTDTQRSQRSRDYDRENSLEPQPDDMPF